jgi:hypothetical protein
MHTQNPIIQTLNLAPPRTFFVASATVIQSVGFGVFQNLIQIWSWMVTIWASFNGVVYIRACGAFFTLEALHSVLKGYFKDTTNGAYTPYHSIQLTF